MEKRIILPIISILQIALVLILMASCEKKADWDLVPTLDTPVVIEGMITDELKTQKISICRTVQQPNDIPQAVQGAEVQVTIGANVYHFHENPVEEGEYLSDEPFRGVAGAEHSLLVTVNGEVYSAKAMMAVISTALSAPNYVYKADTALYHFSWSESSYSPLYPAMYELQLDWSDVPGYQGQDSLATRARMFYYTLTTLDVSEVFPPSAQTIFFPAGTRITEYRYALSTEHVAFIRALLSETAWQGGFFSSASANVPTNISNGAIGYFAACSVVTRTDVVH